jgi:hypothetical protein
MFIAKSSIKDLSFDSTAAVILTGIRNFTFRHSNPLEAKAPLGHVEKALRSICKEYNKKYSKPLAMLEHKTYSSFKVLFRTKHSFTALHIDESNQYIHIKCSGKLDFMRTYERKSSYKVLIPLKRKIKEELELHCVVTKIK